VRDEGIGMSPEQLEVIGLAFTQAESALVRQNGGLGIGLALTSNFVELMRGRLKFESVKGVGTVVRLTFPRASQSASAPPALAAAAS
jgi:signal transduction histidine kinase